MNARRQSRELALQALFQQEFNQSLDVAECLQMFKINFKAPKEIWDYALVLLNGVIAQKKEIDSLIRASSKNWKLERMSLVDLSILRIGTWELKFSNESIPIEVAIDEALEIAKRYSAKDSSAFINGILDQISKT